MPRANDGLNTTSHKNVNPDFWDRYIADGVRDGLIKPDTFQLPDLRQLPAALERLQAAASWVCWQWTWKDGAGPDGAGNWTKPPFIASNPKRFARNNDPKTWGTYAQACAAVTAGKADGIGFALQGSDIAAFDLDNCRDPKTGAIHPAAQAIVDRSNSYCEITPSGTGLRVLGIGSDRYMHRKINNINGSGVSVEAYRNCARYVTVSGMMLPGAMPLLNNIDALIDDVVSELDGAATDDLFNKTPRQSDTPQQEKMKNGGADRVDNVKSNDGANGADKAASNRPSFTEEPPTDHELNYLYNSLPDNLRDEIQIVAAGVDRSRQFYHATQWLKDLGASFAETFALFERYPDGIANRYITEKRLKEEIERVWGKPSKTEDLKDDANTRDAKAKDRLVFSSAEFTHGFVPPSYLWDGILMTGFVYSFTARTGEGKTAVMLSLAAAVALGWDFAGREVEQGLVLYFAGENPDDVCMRWIALAEHRCFNTDDIGVHFISGTFDIGKVEKKIRKEVEALGGVSLVIIDTGPAYFQGENENDTVDMIQHADMLRRLKDLPGNPTVLAATHPTKNAENDNLVPRGGGAFLNAMDGNLCAHKDDMTVTLHHQGKFRGVEFEPMIAGKRHRSQAQRQQGPSDTDYYCDGPFPRRPAQARIRATERARRNPVAVERPQDPNVVVGYRRRHRLPVAEPGAEQVEGAAPDKGSDQSQVCGDQPARRHPHQAGHPRRGYRGRA
jgi:hypothetical protein